MTSEVLAGGRVVTPDRVLDPGYVLIEDSRIAEVGEGTPRSLAPSARPLIQRWLIPGLVDLHVHGGGGGDFTHPDAAAHSRAAEFHARHGTTSLLATTVTTSPPELRATVTTLEAAVAAGGRGA